MPLTLLKKPVRFFSRLNSLKDNTETGAATSFIQGFATPTGLLYFFLVGTTMVFAATALSVFGNQTNLIVLQPDWVAISLIEKIFVAILLLVSPIAFVMPLFLGTLVLIQQGQRSFRIPRFSWLLIPFPLLIITTLKGHLEQFSWIVELGPENVVVRSMIFGVIGLACIIYWFLSFKLKKTVPLRNREKKITVGLLAAFALVYLSNGNDYLSTVSTIVLPSLLWYYGFTFLIPSKAKLKEPKRLAILFSGGIILLLFLNLYEGNNISATLFAVLFILSIVRQLSAKKLETIGKKAFGLKEHTYRSALRYWQY